MVTIPCTSPVPAQMWVECAYDFQKGGCGGRHVAEIAHSVHRKVEADQQQRQTIDDQGRIDADFISPRR
jgi:hypothetical protein